MSSIIFAIAAGAFIAAQSSVNGISTPVVGAIMVSAANFALQLLLLIIFQLVKEHYLPDLRKIPFICWCSGILATCCVAGMGFCVSKMGTAVSTCCYVAGQILISSAVDHFGLFGSNRHPFIAKKIPGLILIIIGVLSMNFIGSSSSGMTVPIPYLMLGVLLGVFAILVRTANARASAVCGTAVGGGMMNGLAGFVSSALVLFVMAGFRPDFSGIPSVWPYFVLASVLGVSSIQSNIMAYKNGNVFYATIFLLIGQVTTGILMDTFIFHALSVGKIIGIIIISTGVLLDKFLTREQ